MAPRTKTIRAYYAQLRKRYYASGVRPLGELNTPDLPLLAALHQGWTLLSEAQKNELGYMRVGRSMKSQTRRALEALGLLSGDSQRPFTLLGSAMGGYVCAMEEGEYATSTASHFHGAMTISEVTVSSRYNEHWRAIDSALGERGSTYHGAVVNGALRVEKVGPSFEVASGVTVERNAYAPWAVRDVVSGRVVIWNLGNDVDACIHAQYLCQTSGASGWQAWSHPDTVRPIYDIPDEKENQFVGAHLLNWRVASIYSATQSLHRCSACGAEFRSREDAEAHVDNARREEQERRGMQIARSLN